jgi:DNA-binding GntR family transcriptional regulator
VTIRIPRGEFDLKDQAIELMVRLDIAVVRQMLAPGQIVTEEDLRLVFDADGDDVASVVERAVSGGLLERVGDRLRVPALVHSDIVALLDERTALEERITREVVPKLPQDVRERMRHLIRHAHMAAVVGDLEIMVKHDTAIDDLIADAYADRRLVERSRVVKSLIRRIWADTQPYLDLVPMMELRRLHVEAIVEGDADAAARRSADVIDAVRRLLVAG